MNRQTPGWRLALTSFLLALIPALGIGLYARHACQEQSLQHARSQVRQLGALAAESLSRLDSPTHTELAAWLRVLADSTGSEMTVFGDGAQRLASSGDGRGRDLETFGPEVRDALRTDAPAMVRRTTPDGSASALYIAVPAQFADGRRVVLQLSRPLTAAMVQVDRFDHGLGMALLAVVTAAAVLCAVLLVRMKAAAEELTVAAFHYSKGEFQYRVGPPGLNDWPGVGTALNRMAAALQERVGAVTRQRNEQEAILSSMVEGVVAIDTEEKVIGLNRAAASMLELSATREHRGRNLQGVVRNVALQDFIAATLRAEQPVEGDIALYGDRERFIQVHGAPLRDSEGNTFGAVAVLNDVTRLRRLEQLRREFAANVSHEVKTPITSIKGFVETLLDGALDSPEDARRFLGIILDQTDRLSAIIEDLLLLSRIEKQQELESIQLTQSSLRPRLESVIATCDAMASASDIDVQLDCPSELLVRVNPILFEQAVMNLLKNAINYSPKGAGIRVAVRRDHAANEIQVAVHDHGPGIPAEHLDRLFERFYRVDKARSRAVGGTGLGLAIVKHVMYAHAGRVSVTSTVGKGSTFVLHLPGSARGEQASPAAGEARSRQSKAHQSA